MVADGRGARATFQAVGEFVQPCRRAAPGQQLADEQSRQPVVGGPLRSGLFHREQRGLRGLGSAQRQHRVPRHPSGDHRHVRGLHHDIAGPNTTS